MCSWRSDKGLIPVAVSVKYLCFVSINPINESHESVFFVAALFLFYFLINSQISALCRLAFSIIHVLNTVLKKVKYPGRELQFLSCVLGPPTVLKTFVIKSFRSMWSWGYDGSKKSCAWKPPRRGQVHVRLYKRLGKYNNIDSGELWYGSRCSLFHDCTYEASEYSRLHVCITCSLLLNASAALMDWVLRDLLFSVITCTSPAL